MCLCPMNLSEKGSVKLMKRFAEKLASGEVCGLSTATIPKSPKNFFDLASLCHLFNELELFMWLQKKFPPGNIMEQQLAHSRREETVYHISQGLANSDKLQLKHCYVQQAQYYRQIWDRNNHSANKNSNKNYQHRQHGKRTTRHRPTTTTGEILVEEESDEWH
jgi:Mitochondrial degradasome RNA helicase subunit C terminal